MKFTHWLHHPDIARAARMLLLVLGTGFFVGALVHGKGEIGLALQRVHWQLFCCAILTGLLDGMIVTLMFRSLLNKYGLALATPIVGQMYFLGQLAKYIPGKIWNIAFHTTMINVPGARGPILAANMDLALLGIFRTVALAATLLAGFAGLLHGVVVYVGTTIMMGSLASSRMTWTALRHFARFLPGPGEGSGEHASFPKRPLTALYAMSTITLLLSYYLVMTAAFDLDPAQSLACMAAFMLAWLVGTLAFVVPGGIGVREMAFVLLAGHIGGAGISAETLTAIAVVFRAWQLLLEAAGALLGVAFRKFS